MFAAVFLALCLTQPVFDDAVTPFQVHDHRLLFRTSGQWSDCAGVSAIPFVQGGRQSVYRYWWPGPSRVSLQISAKRKPAISDGQLRQLSDDQGRDGHLTGLYSPHSTPAPPRESNQLALSEPIALHSIEAYGLIDSEPPDPLLYWNVLRSFDQEGYRAEKVLLMARDTCSEEWKPHPSNFIRWRYYAPTWKQVTREKFWRSFWENK